MKNQITLIDVQRSKESSSRLVNGGDDPDRPSLWSKSTVAGVQVLEMSIEDNKEAGGPIDIVQIVKVVFAGFPKNLSAKPGSASK